MNFAQELVGDLSKKVQKMSQNGLEQFSQSFTAEDPLFLKLLKQAHLIGIT